MDHNSGIINDYTEEAILPEEEVVMAIKTEPEVLIEHDEETAINFESKLDLILKKVEGLENLRATIDVIVRQQVQLEMKLDNCHKKQDELVKILGEHKILLTRNLSNVSLASGRFPIKSDDELKSLEDDLMGKNRENLVMSMRRLLSDDLPRNLERIFDSNLISRYNYDGTKGKKAMKFYTNILTALNECTSFESFEKFLLNLRSAIKKVKNRDAKRQARKDESKMDLDDLKKYNIYN